MQWFINNWGITLAAFMLLEKLVKLSPATWDDIVVDGLKAIFKAARGQ